MHILLVLSNIIMEQRSSALVAYGCISERSILLYRDSVDLDVWQDFCILHKLYERKHKTKFTELGDIPVIETRFYFDGIQIRNMNKPELQWNQRQVSVFGLVSTVSIIESRASRKPCFTSLQSTNSVGGKTLKKSSIRFLKFTYRIPYNTCNRRVSSNASNTNRTSVLWLLQEHIQKSIKPTLLLF